VGGAFSEDGRGRAWTGPILSILIIATEKKMLQKEYFPLAKKINFCYFICEESNPPLVCKVKYQKGYAYMAEEKKEKREPAKKPEKAAKKEVIPAPSEGSGGSSKNKKINKMNLAEIEAKLEEVKSSQGGLASKYAKHLLLQKKTISS
jgi:hypothetical protein